MHQGKYILQVYMPSTKTMFIKTYHIFDNMQINTFTLGWGRDIHFPGPMFPCRGPSARVICLSSHPSLLQACWIRVWLTLLSMLSSVPRWILFLWGIPLDICTLVYLFMHYSWSRSLLSSSNGEWVGASLIQG